MVRVCSQPGCQEPHLARGFCHRHYRQHLRAGNVAPKPLQRHYGYTPEERFWLYVEKPDRGCWVWTGYRNEKGYGVINLGGERMLAHRFAYQLVADIPDGISVLHSCDNPACVRFKHLFLGTRADNNADMDAKGRSRRVGAPSGTRNPSTKLTETDVRAIRASLEPVRELARRYGTSRVHIYAIKQRRYWAHVQ